MVVMEQELLTLDDVRAYLKEGFRATEERSLYWNRDHVLGFGITWGELPDEIANPAPLIAHAARLGGEPGLTARELQVMFCRLGTAAVTRGIRAAVDAGLVTMSEEERANHAGRLWPRLVVRATRRTPGAGREASRRLADGPDYQGADAAESRTAAYH